MSILYVLFPNKYNDDNYNNETFSEPNNRLGGGWVIGLIVGSLVAFALPLLIIIHLPGSQTTLKELSTLASSTATTIPMTTTTELQTTSTVLSTSASTTETTTTLVTTTAAASSKSLRVCENGVAHFQCLPNQMIVVQSVFYGRNDSTTCPDPSVQNWQGACSLATALQVVSSRCLHLSDCSFQVSSVLFPDPCVNVLKFFLAEYNCTDVTKNSTTVCEGKAADLRCVAGERIDVVNVFYGRRDRTTCSDSSINNWSSTCNTNNALDLVSSRCNNLESCNVPADGSLFGDPCPGVLKYLEIEYFCVA